MARSINRSSGLRERFEVGLLNTSVIIDLDVWGAEASPFWG